MANTVAARVRNLSALSEHPERLTETPPPPKTAKVGVTMRCNFNCTFCETRVDGHGGRVMPMHEREEIFRKLRDVGVEEIGLFLWGESTTDPTLPEAIALAKDFGFSNIFLTCNGSVAVPEKIRAYLEEGLTSLKFSMNAADAENFSDITKRPAALFERTLRNFEAAVEVRDEVFQETGHWCLVSASWILLYPNREAEMQGVIERLEKAAGKESVYCLPPYSIEGNLSDVQREKGWIVVIGNPGTFDTPHAPIPCHIPFSMAVIDEYGRLCACCFHHGTHAPDFVIGSLLDRDFMDVWHDEKFRTLRRAHLASWKTRDMSEACGTICNACLTPPQGLSGLLPGQEPFLPRP